MPGFSSEMSDDEKRHQLACAVWHAMECHQVMEEFAEAKFVSHHLISSVFVRFLAEETGANFSAGLAVTLSELRGIVDELRKTQEKTTRGLSWRMDNHTENIKAVMKKAEVKYVPYAKND